METLDDLSEQIRRIEDFSDTMKSINRMDDLCVRRSKVVASILQRKTADVFDTLSGTGKKEYSIVEKLSQEQFNIDMDVYLEILENTVLPLLCPAIFFLRLKALPIRLALSIMVCL